MAIKHSYNGKPVESSGTASFISFERLKNSFAQMVGLRYGDETITGITVDERGVTVHIETTKGGAQ